MKKESDNIRKILDVKDDEELISLVVEEYADKRLTQEKLLEAGRSGIAKAHDLYDETKDFNFNGYAVWWVRQRIIQAIYEKGSDSSISDIG